MFQSFYSLEMQAAERMAEAEARAARGRVLSARRRRPAGPGRLVRARQALSAVLWRVRRVRALAP